jgi:hypothetical protein
MARPRAGIVTVNGFSVWWGKSGDLKSFVLLDFGLCVATGLDWHGFEVRRGPVLYIAAEGAYGLARRAYGWLDSRRHNGHPELDAPNFRIIPTPLALTTAEDLDALLVEIKSLPEVPILIIVDTLARTFGAGNENSQPDMNAYVNAMDRLREATGAHVAVVHHSGVHDQQRERGSNVLRGAADTIIKVKRNGDRVDIINKAPAGKQKDAEEFSTIKLRTVKIAFTAPDGDEESTLILMKRDGADLPESDVESDDAEPVKLGKNEQVAYDALRKAGEALGLMRLLALTGIEKSNLNRALNGLVDKDKATVELDETGERKQWRAL